MAQHQSETHFLGKKELAIRYNICLATFSRWLKRIEKQVPFYVKGQRLFCPSQIKKIDDLLCFSPDTKLDFED
jgi:hypothetical protein